MGRHRPHKVGPSGRLAPALHGPTWRAIRSAHVVLVPIWCPIRSANVALEPSHDGWRLQHYTGRRVGPTQQPVGSACKARPLLAVVFQFPFLFIRVCMLVMSTFWWIYRLINLKTCIFITKCKIFTALHGMQTRSYDEISVRPSVCPSVCLSVCQMRALWQNGRKLCLDFYIIRKNIYPSFLRRRMVGGGDPFYLKFWVNRPALEQNRRFWTDNRS